MSEEIAKGFEKISVDIAKEDLERYQGYIGNFLHVKNFCCNADLNILKCMILGQRWKGSCKVCFT
jgi:hypothetical protein